MCTRKRLSLGLFALLVLAIGAAGPALAQPDFTETVVLSEDDGFPGICAQPCFEVEKTAEVYFSGNPSAPPVCGPGENTYVYRITNLANPPSNATLAPPGIPITDFELAVDSSLVADAGTLPGPGTIFPIATVIGALDLVPWSFPDNSQCPGCLDQGKASEDLYICSTASPGSSPGNASATAFTLDASGTCTVPSKPCELDVEKLCEVVGSPAGVETNQCEGPKPGVDVKYTYRIKNVGTVDATNVAVEDDVLGTVAGSPIASIAPGETVELMETELVTQDTTNSVTVVGDPGLCAAEADATVTLFETCPCFTAADLAGQPSQGFCLALNAWSGFYTEYTAWPLFHARVWQSHCWFQSLSGGGQALSPVTPPQLLACRQLITEAATNAGLPCSVF